MTASNDDDGPMDGLMPTPSPGPEKRSGVAIEAKLQAHIGRQLRLLYDQVVLEPVPDRFRLLLDRLEAQETAQEIGQETEAGSGTGSGIGQDLSAREKSLQDDTPEIETSLSNSLAESAPETEITR